MRWIGRLSARKLVQPHQWGDCCYSNWPSLVGPQSLCYRFFWWRFLCWHDVFFIFLWAFVIGLSQISSFLSYHLIPLITQNNPNILQNVDWKLVVKLVKWYKELPRVKMTYIPVFNLRFLRIWGLSCVIRSTKSRVWHCPPWDTGPHLLFQHLLWI